MARIVDDQDGDDDNDAWKTTMLMLGQPSKHNDEANDTGYGQMQGSTTRNRTLNGTAVTREDRVGWQ